MALTSELWAQKRVARITTSDVKSAFDGVLKGRLVQRLQEQCWVSSFCLERETRIRLDGRKTELFPIKCGLPQGSQYRELSSFYTLHRF